jgi:hypothetical protein
MKTLEVLEKVPAGKRVSESRKRSYKSAFSCLNKFSVEWPDDMFEKIPNEVSIRPMLGAKDLLCLRRMMVEYTRAHRGDSLVYQSQDLLKRMLRKAK